MSACGCVLGNRKDIPAVPLSSLGYLPINSMSRSLPIEALIYIPCPYYIVSIFDSFLLQKRTETDI